jgi:hypothetical protein
MTFIYKTQLSSDAGLPTFWWDSSRPDADATLHAFAQNMHTASRSNAYIYTLEQWSIEVTTKHRHRRFDMITDVLNGVTLNRLMLRVQMIHGEVTSYERNRSATADNTDIIPVLPATYPTPEYAKQYKTMLSNPALFELCARCKTITTWYAIAERAQFKSNRRILRWLFYIVHTGGDIATK